MYEDKTLKSKECGKEFVFTAGEQEFYAERGFRTSRSAEVLCAMRARMLHAVRVSSSPLPVLLVAARVPFEPKSDRPVYCSECFAKMREQ